MEGQNHAHSPTANHGHIHSHRHTPELTVTVALSAFHRHEVYLQMYKACPDDIVFPWTLQRCL